MKTSTDILNIIRQEVSNANHDLDKGNYQGGDSKMWLLTKVSVLSELLRKVE